MTTLPLATLLIAYADGDQRGWAVEMADCRRRAHYPALLADIREHGIRTPVLLGDDGRVWDGHHRITAAADLGIVEISVMRA